MNQIPMFSAIPLRGLPVRGLYVLLTAHGVLPGVVFNSLDPAQWVAAQLSERPLSEVELRVLFTNPLQVQNLVRQLCANYSEATLPVEVTQLLEGLEAIGWSQVKLARKLQLDPNTVSRWITGRTPVPGFVLEYLGTLRAVKDLVVKLGL